MAWSVEPALWNLAVPASMLIAGCTGRLIVGASDTDSSIRFTTTVSAGTVTSNPNGAFAYSLCMSSTEIPDGVRDLATGDLGGDGDDERAFIQGDVLVVGLPGS